MSERRLTLTFLAILVASAALGYVVVDDTHDQVVGGIKTWTKQLLLQGQAPPAISPPNQSAIYYDVATQTLMHSDNAGAYVPFAGAAPTPTPLAFSTPGKMVVFGSPNLQPYKGFTPSPDGAYVIGMDAYGAPVLATPLPVPTSGGGGGGSAPAAPVGSLQVNADGTNLGAYPGFTPAPGGAYVVGLSASGAPTLATPMPTPTPGSGGGGGGPTPTPLTLPLSPQNGGTGQDSSTTTGYPVVTNGVWAFPTAIPQSGVDNLTTDISNIYTVVGGIGGSAGQGNAVTSSCQPANVGGLTWAIPACTFIVNGVSYTSTPTNVTLAPADTTNPRIDTFIFDTTVVGYATSLTGVAEAFPSEPGVDPNTQVKITSINLPANATTIPSLVNEVVYAENVEWTMTQSGGAGWNCADTSSPHAGTKACKSTNSATNNTLKFTRATAIDLTPFQQLLLWIKPVTWASTRSFALTMRNANNAQVGNAVTVKDGSFGFKRTGTTAYQLVSIPMSAFNVPSGVLVKGFWMNPTGSSVVTTYVDDVALQSSSTQSGYVAPGATNSVLVRGSGGLAASSAFSANGQTMYADNARFGSSSGPMQLGIPGSGAPSIAAQASESGNDATVEIDVPATTRPGDRLLTFVLVDTSAFPTTGLPAGWSTIVNGQAGGHSTAGKMSVYTKVADGSEASQFQLATNGGVTQRWQSITYRIINSDTTATPETTSAVTAAPDSSPNPPALTPSWGSASTLWFALEWNACCNATAFPSSYGSTFDSATPPNALNMALASRQSTTTTEDPSSFTLNGSANGTGAMTFAVKPMGIGSVRTAWSIDPTSGMLISQIAGAGPASSSGPLKLGIPSASAFPAVVGTTSVGTESGNPSSHTGTVPSGIQAGDLLLMLTGTGSGVTLTLPTGWVNQRHTTLTSAVVGQDIWYKICDGTETNFSFTTSSGANVNYQMFLIRNAYSSAPVESATPVQSDVGSNVAADPPSLTPSWGSGHTLWFSLLNTNNPSTQNITAYPSGFTNGSLTNNGSGGSAIATAYLGELNAAKDPAQYTWSSGGARIIATTIAVRVVSESTIIQTGATIGTDGSVNTVAGVNNASLVPAAASTPISVVATGSDTNIGINLVTKGSGQAMVNGTPIGGAAPTPTPLANLSYSGQLNVTGSTAISASATPKAGDRNIDCTAGSSADQTYALPAATGSGRVLDVTKVDSGTKSCLLAPSGSDTINGGSSRTLSAQWAHDTCRDWAASKWLCVGAGGVAAGGSGTVTNAAALTANQLVIGAGGNAVAALGTLGTTTTVLHGNPAGAPSFGAVALATDVSGNLAVANLDSGNNATSYRFWRGDGTWRAPYNSEYMASTAGNTLLTGQTQFLPLSGSMAAATSANEVQAGQVSNHTGFFNTLACSTQNNVTPGSGKSYAITLRDNQTDTPITCTISNTATSCTDTIDTVTIAGGHFINYKIIPASTPTAAALMCTISKISQD